MNSTLASSPSITDIWFLSGIVAASLMLTVALGFCFCVVLPKWNKQHVDKASNLIVEEKDEFKVYRKNARVVHEDDTNAATSADDDDAEEFRRKGFRTITLND